MSLRITEPGEPQAPSRSTERFPERDYGLDILRIVSICGVVAIHVFGHVIGHAPRQSQQWWGAVVLDRAWTWVVPVFVMISGALILGSGTLVDNPGLFYLRRAVRLFPALIAWHLIYLIGVRLWMREENLTLQGTVQLLVDGAVFTHLYFLWLIAGLYAVAPVLAGFLRGGNQMRALTSAAAFLGLAMLVYIIPGVLDLFGVVRPIALNVLTHWVPYVGYFVAGYALRNVRLTGDKLAVVAGATAFAIAATVWHYGKRGTFPVLDALFSDSYLGVGAALSALGVFVVTLSLAARLSIKRAGKPIVELSNATFGVFLVHLVLFESLQRLFPAVSAGLSIKVMMLAYAGTLVGSFAVSLASRRIPLLRNIF